MIAPRERQPATPTVITQVTRIATPQRESEIAVRYDLPIRPMGMTSFARSAVVIWCYADGSAGIALRPWRAV